MHETAAVTRKLFFAAVGWVFGLVCFLKFSLFVNVCIAVAGILFSAIFFSLRKIYVKFAALIMIFAVLGGSYGAYYQNFVYSQITFLAGKEVTMNGYVTDFDYSSGGSVRLTVRGRINGGKKTTVTAYCTDQNFDYGDSVRLKFKAKVPENTLTFSGEDYNRSLGIYLTSSGRADCEKLGGCANIPLRTMKKIRDRTIGIIRAKCGGQTGAFLVASLCSDKDKLSADTKNAVYRTGLGHLFAVSGTHVVMLTAFLLPIITILVKSAKLRATIMLALVWCFAIFSGGSLSVVRACIMASISLTSAFFNRDGDSANSLGAAAIAITLNCPYAITSVSFIMSFAASFAFGVLSPAICYNRITSKSARTLISYICINIVTLPFCAYYFSEISVISIAANILLIPLCTVCLSLSFIYTLSYCTLTPFIKYADFLASIILKLCNIISSSKYSYVGTYYYKVLLLWGVFALLALIGCCLKRTKRLSDIVKCCGIYVTICVFACYLTRIKVQDNIIIYPNENSYTAMLQCDGKTLIFDINDLAEMKYTLDANAKKLHSEHSYIFIEGSPVYTAISYEKQFGNTADCFSREINSTQLGIIGINDDVKIGATTVTTIENGYMVKFDGTKIVLTSDEINIDGVSYQPNGFFDKSQIYF